MAGYFKFKWSFSKFYEIWYVTKLLVLVNRRRNPKKGICVTAHTRMSWTVFRPTPQRTQCDVLSSADAAPVPFHGNFSRLVPPSGSRTERVTFVIERDRFTIEFKTLNHFVKEPDLKGRDLITNCCLSISLRRFWTMSNEFQCRLSHSSLSVLIDFKHFDALSF